MPRALTTALAAPSPSSRPAQPARADGPQHPVGRVHRRLCRRPAAGRQPAAGLGHGAGRRVHRRLPRRPRRHPRPARPRGPGIHQRRARARAVGGHLRRLRAGHPGRHGLRASRLKIAPVPVVSRWKCIRQCAPGGKVKGDSLLLVRGLRLARRAQRRVPRRPGRADDLRARVSDQRFDSFRMRVPVKAVTGTFSARERRGGSPAASSPCRRPRRAGPPGAAAGVFPVRGAHTFGGAGARFGAGRSGHTHQGQDVHGRRAACRWSRPPPARSSTPGYQSSAGNYLVIRGTAPVQDYVYMHLQAPPAVSKGAAVGRRPADRRGGRDRQRPGLSPALRDLERPGLVRRRQAVRPAAPAAGLGGGGLGRPPRPACARAPGTSVPAHSSDRIA